MKNSHGDPTSGSAGDRGKLPRSNDPRSLYVITLFSSLMPMPLEVPDPRGLEGLAVFRSRRVEDGRERFRLHLGYFDSRTDAEDTLPVVQKHFPSAWVASAPRSGLGSLDDTNLSEFRLIRSPTLLAMEIERRSNAATPPPQNTQRYVVQLSWADRRIDPSEVSQLAIFRAYALYTVTLARAGVRYYGIRLGFFTSAISARQVALYVREEFPEVAVVPISEREYTRAREMIAQREIRAIPEAASAPEPDIRAEPITTDASEDVPVEASVLTEITDIATDDVPATEAAMESAALETVTESVAAESVALETAGQSTAPQTAADSVASEIAAESLAPEAVAESLAPEAAAESAAPAIAAESTTSAITPQSAPPAPPQPFTEVYVAEATARMAGRTSTHAFTREELLGALAGTDSRSGENAHRSAIVRLLHRLADRIG